MNTAPEVFQFFGYWQMVVCLFAFAAIMAIWRHFTTHRPTSMQDQGLVWLALSILVWGFSGILEVLQARQQIEALYLNSGRSMLSILNSMFILLSLPYFKHKPKAERVKILLEPKPWTFWVVTISLIFLMLTVLFTAFLSGILQESVNGDQHVLYKAINVIDVLYAFLTLAMLGLVLWNSFDERNLRILAYLTVICILFTVIGQVFKVLDNDFWGLFFSCTFKTMLIMIFLALALSWVAEELEEEFLPAPTAILLKLTQQTNGKKQLVKLHLPPHLPNGNIWFNGAPFQLLQKFAERRQKEPAEGGWLKMKPKGMNTRHDIANYNQMKSIFKEILNHQHGKDNWSNHDLNFIRKAMVEKHPQKEGYYRLRLEPKNIELF